MGAMHANSVAKITAVKTACRGLRRQAVSPGGGGGGFVKEAKSQRLQYDPALAM